MSADIVIRLVDGSIDTWDFGKFGFTVRDNGNLMIQLAGEASKVSVAVYAAGQWVSVIDGGWS